MSRTRRIALSVVALFTLALVAVVAEFWHQGYRIYVVHTGSMEPTYNPGDLVIDQPARHLRAGDVITFRHSAVATDVVTHRITDITPTGLIHTKGDANRTADVWDIRPDQVQGRVHAVLRGFGYLAVFLQQPAGIGSIATCVLAIALLWGLFFPPSDDPVEDSGGSDDTPEDDREPAPDSGSPTLVELVLAMEDRPLPYVSRRVTTVT